MRGYQRHAAANPGPDSRHITLPGMLRICLHTGLWRASAPVMRRTAASRAVESNMRSTTCGCAPMRMRHPDSKAPSTSSWTYIRGYALRTSRQCYA